MTSFEGIKNTFIWHKVFRQLLRRKYKPYANFLSRLIAIEKTGLPLLWIGKRHDVINITQPFKYTVALFSAQMSKVSSIFSAIRLRRMFWMVPNEISEQIQQLGYLNSNLVLRWECPFNDQLAVDPKGLRGQIPWRPSRHLFRGTLSFGSNTATDRFGLPGGWV